MFPTIDFCEQKCIRLSFQLPVALFVLFAFIFVFYYLRYSQINIRYFLKTIRDFFKNAKIKRAFRVIRDRPEYMDNFLLVLSSLLFGLGSWIAITGLWLEMPVLIHHLPEKWSLASYLTFAIQLANIAPLIYWYLNRKYSKYCNEVSATNLQLLIGVLGSITLIFYWDQQTFIFGGQHSVVLLTCGFLLSIVDCLSSVTFLPFMARFKAVYLTPYLIGEGLSGFLPTILAILQDVEDQYNNPDDYKSNNVAKIEDIFRFIGYHNSTTTNTTDTLTLNSTIPINSTTTNLKKTISTNKHNYTMNNPEVARFGPEVFFLSLLATLIISWLAFFYLQFHQPSHFERRNSLPLPEKKRKTVSKLSKYLFGYDPVERKREEERWEKRKQVICQQERLNKDVIRVVKQNQHLLKENLHVTILQNNPPTAIDAISTSSFTAIKSSTKPLIKDNPITLPNNRIRKSKKKRFDKEKFEYYFLQFLMFFACTLGFGLLQPIQPFSCLSVSHSTLKYSVILSGLSYPVGCSIAIFFKCRSTKKLTLLTILAASIAAFLFWSALHSPDLPPIFNLSFIPQNSTLIDNNLNSNDTDFDSSFYEERDENTALKQFLMHIDRHQSLIISIFLVTCWVAFNLTLSYVKTMVTIRLNEKKGQEALFYVGLVSQLGCLLGATFMFIAVNHLTWFKQK